MASEKRIPIWPVAGLLVLLSVAVFAWSRSAASVEETKDKEQKDKADTNAVPEGKPAVLLKFMRKQVDKIREEPPEKKEDFNKVLTSIAQAAEKLLGQKATAAERLEAVQAKWAMLRALSQNGEKAAGMDIPKFLKRFAKDQDDDVREFAIGRLLAHRAEDVAALDNKQREQLVKDAIAYIQGGTIQNRFGVLMGVGQMLEQSKQGELASRVYLAGAAVLKKSDKEEIRAQAKIIEGMARRSVLVGKTFELSGTKVDGKPFKWSDYKGKVVLVDFWATWCGPCRAAMPRLKEYYETYRSKGFEIVGVSVDEKLDVLQEFLKKEELPWTNLFSRDPKASGGSHPMAVYYGVDKYPTTILVDQKGKVVELDVHGARLGRLLAKLLEKGDGKDGSKSDAKAPKAPK